MRKRVPISQLKQNTAISADVYTEDFQLIIKKGTVLTDKVLNRLKLFNIEDVYIDEENTVLSKVSDEYQEEFREFKAAYTNVSDNLSNSLNNIVEKNFSAAQLDKTIDNSIDLYISSSSSLSILDMLNHMRDFSDNTYLHSLNVGMIAAIIGKWSGKSTDDQRLLLACGLFHDVGKLLIPKEILDKPGKLTNEEFEVMKSHTTKGYKLLSDLNIDNRIKFAALMHHEKMDGSGYPLGLKGNKIDEFARILTIADIYDALTAARVYRGPICPFDALEIFEKDGYQLYDVKYLLTFLQNVINTYMHSQVILSNGQHGEIIMVNKTHPSKPLIMSGTDCIDLSKDKNVKIEKIIQD